MNIHEYQAKEILRSYDVAVPNGSVISDAQEAEGAAWRIETEVAVVKAQIHAGGRGKAGGVKIARGIDEVKAYAKELLGKQLVTHQTGKEGRTVRAILIEEGCEILKEYYLALTLDREASRIAMIASEEGGMDIEEVAAATPEKIFTTVIDPLTGATEFQARMLCYKLNIPNGLINDVVKLMLNLYRCFIEKDCMLVEINPLVITKDQRLMALDAKFNFDSNALYRQQEVMAYRDLNEEDGREIEASKYGLAYISLEGNIGCMVNGAGLAMATMDMIKHFGGEPANFLDVGGGASEEKVKQAFKIILSDTQVKGIFVNIFGGIMKCDVIAKGIIKAAKEVDLKVPLVVRLEGTNVEAGKAFLEASGLKIETAETIGEGAKKIVELTNQRGGY